MGETAIIIGAGPAGLTAAYELLTRSGITPVILEKSGDIGGISKTVNYKGNRMDMGPHRFFSKSDRVMNWWLDMFPLDTSTGGAATISYQNKKRDIQSKPGAAQPREKDKVMLVIPRLTRIYFLRRFFAYPIQLSIDTLKTLGPVRTVKIVFSYLYARFFPRKPEKSLEDFITNKFGKQLYLLFFKDYTEKVWGIPCNEISAEWGAQRIKGVSLSKAISHAIKTMVKKPQGDLGQKGTETSLIEQFLYPKLGAGQLWEHVADAVQAMGGTIIRHQDVKEIVTYNNKVTGISTVNTLTGETNHYSGEYFISTMPVQELIAGIAAAPEEIKHIAAGLQYRDFVNVGVLLKRLSAKDKKTGVYKEITLDDSWVYIQEREVKLGRLQVYNNWGPGMVKDPNTTWLGLEYFCNKTDAFWAQTDEQIKKIAIDELISIELIHPNDVLDITVQRMEKTYPAYFGTYEQFDQVKDFLEHYPNLFLVGRNGMHKYNNTDHSMLTAMVAVDNILDGVKSKDNLWSINTEQEYHEEKKETEEPKVKVVHPNAHKPSLVK
ncbi:Protoporphyrinogen oxidase [Filimonas lacunae]|uniref:Protoporphyrinogen oxidase n=1 Tax=Filimonas lacunae TaxID=477680 RepID=A0A173MJF6_9BACT|nr:NAD(P)/FAD-dependent oxidoreductase [Filimonas lacunae]BAV07744.1 protoporphyrinogen oxidase [Filimonas lacunae]SIT04309.1 Protoporphyrinogen oxidase [Filimonas lacunae]